MFEMELPTAYPLRDLFDAAVRHRSIRLICRRCGHAAVFGSPALWWLFERNGWPDRFNQVPRHFYCRLCWRLMHIRAGSPRLELVDQAPTDTSLPLPTELDWKRELRRRR